MESGYREAFIGKDKIVFMGKKVLLITSYSLKKIARIH